VQIENEFTISSPHRKISDLSRYWRAEQNAPKWFKDSNETWRQSESEFLSFCDKCKVYEIGNALLIIEDFGERAEIHFCVDGNLPDGLVNELKNIKAELLRQHSFIFGWVVRQNRGIKAIAAQLGLRFHGFKMHHGISHGKVLEWHCYSLHWSESFVVADRKNLLLSL
jgi:hypothetical protein